ncbi:MAG TPA: hypothetical protein VMW28_07105 [Pelolinea sp.]|nr:hypothetical protein [Pelolinea sp.]
MKKRKILYLIIAIGIFAIATAIYSFAASNTVPSTYLGEGAGTISGYIVSNITYVLNSSNPSNLDEVQFTLDNSASTVKIKLVAAGSDFYDCALNAGTWECPTTSPQATVVSADELRVIASE